MSDPLASALASDAPAVESPSSAPAAPATPAPEPSRRDTIVAAVEAQKERAAPDGEKAAKAPASAAERARAPDGKFAPSTDKPAPDRTAPEGDALKAAKSSETPGNVAVEGDAQSAAATDAPRPPPGWSPASKVAFDALPDHVKSDIAKREREVNTGLAKLAEFKPVEKYAEMARRGGTTLDRALENYTGIENLLRRDVFAGVEQVLRNVGVNPESFARAYLQRGGSPQGTPQGAGPAAHQPAAIDPQEIVQQARAAVRAEYAQREVTGEIERFAADPKNRFFANVEPHLVKLLQSGLAGGGTPRERLQTAYDMACRMDPEISRLINAPPAPDPRKAAADQARAAARATVGAPSPGAVSSKGGAPSNASRRDVILAAVAAQRGARA